MKILKVSFAILLFAATSITGSLYAASEQRSDSAQSNHTPQEKISTPRETANPPPNSRLKAEEVQTLLDMHNQVRADVSVKPVVWSEKLALYAQEWADHLASTSCQMEHRPGSGKWKQQYGENLFVGTAGHYSVADAVAGWESEKKYYKGDAIDSSNFVTIGHYTQVVWKNTKHLGCGSAECNGNMLVVCNYDPPGNFLGQKPY
jgi:pathogenesis-related protein 1